MIGQYEVTQAQWESYGLANPSVAFPMDPNDKGNCLAPNCPVGNINWFEAAAYSNVVSEAEGFPPCYILEGCRGAIGSDLTCSGVTLRARSVYECAGYRLPTEAEWEYAARACTTTAIYSGDLLDCKLSICSPDSNLGAIAWFCTNSAAQSHPVGQLTPNGWGLYDAIGNLHEWTHGAFTPSGYGDAPLIDPGGEDGPVSPTTARTRRGCAYFTYNSSCRAAERASAPMGSRAPGQGVRLARTLAR
jgi:formylglycine-generating enzyme required for sulfatase activity